MLLACLVLPPRTGILFAHAFSCLGGCRYAQELLLARDISLVLNVKPGLLERIARCTGAQVRALPQRALHLLTMVLPLRLLLSRG